MYTASSLLLASLVLTAGAPDDGAADYLRDVKPVLAARCYSCHGAVRQRGGLRLDTAGAIRRGGDSGSALVPGKAADSLLLRRLLGQDGLARMPPRREGGPLGAAEVAAVRRWIDGGAAAPPGERAEADPRDHWAFRPPVRPAVPEVPNAGWVRNPVDAFVAAGHGNHGLVPQPPAGRGLLLRRVYIDLIGLPPTPEQLADFLADGAPDAYEKVVDRLLASPQYGERWGRHWLDVWRYSDWWGLGQQLRNSQKHIWHWRDWVVASLNADKGYDRMVLEMLAADELYPADPSALPATGFLARHYFLFNRNTWLDETVEHTGKAFLGLTLNCAKCHDHKYDPVAQADYSRFRAFFEPYQIRLDQAPGQPDFEKDGIPRVFDCDLNAPTYLHVRGNEADPDRSLKITPGLPEFFAADLDIRPVELPPAAYNPGLQPFVLEDHLRAAARELSAAEQRLAKAREGGDATAGAAAEKQVALARQKAETLRARAAADRAAADPDAGRAKMLAAAAALAERQLAVAQAEADLAAAVQQARADPKKDATEPARARLEAARKALAGPGAAYTPLPGALKTPGSNLESEADRQKPFPKTSTGRRSALAQWLVRRDNPLTARVAVNHMWGRHFGRPLVPTVFDFGRKGAPPSHPDLLDWLAVEFMEHGWSMKHIHRLIVTSYTYRMSSSGAGAPAANRDRDPDNTYLWKAPARRMESQVVRDSLLHLAGELDLTRGGPPVEGAAREASRRRSLYFFHSAIDRDAFLKTFDDADPLECYRRRESVVPQQALALSNSKLALDCAEKIAARLPDGRGGDRDFARAAFAAVLCRAPDDGELSACEQALARWRGIFQSRPGAGRKAQWHLIQALLNHNDFVTVR